MDHTVGDAGDAGVAVAVDLRTESPVAKSPSIQPWLSVRSLS